MALSLEDLRAFVLIAKERSVSKAAVRLGVSQQSVSERIRRIERRLDKKLFLRRPHGMRLTPEGYTLIPYASKIIALIDEGVAAINNEGALRVLVAESVATAIEPFRSRIVTPQTTLTIDGSAEEILAAIGTGEADIGIGDFTESATSSHAAPDLVDDESRDPVATNGSGSAQPGGDSLGGAEALPREAVVIEALFTDPVVWAAPSDHPFASRTSISLEEINGINVGSSPEAAVVNPGGHGADSVRICPRSMIASQLASGELVELPVNRTGWVIPISIAYRALESDRPGVQSLRDALIEAHNLSVASFPDAPHPFTEVHR